MSKDILILLQPKLRIRHGNHGFGPMEKRLSLGVLTAFNADDDGFHHR